MNYSAEEIGKKIKEERLKLGWSQENLGSELGQKSGAKQISKYESGTLPPLDVLLKLCEIFNCELGYLLGEEEYSSGTKIDTAIEARLGLTKEAIDSIYHITGNDRSCIDWGYHSDEYTYVLNKLLSEPALAGFIDSLRELDNQFKKRSAVWDKLKEKYGDEVLDKAFDYYHSTTDYLRDDTAEKLDDIYYEALVDIDNTIDDYVDFEYPIKVCRYDAKEALERLLDNLYPKE